MLPFETRPWARRVALAVVVVTLAAAVAAPFYLRHIKHLDPPMAVLVVLLVLAIVPPNLAILRRQRGAARGGEGSLVSRAVR
jgi:uncharacterized membrane protein YoaK (UPF0700 family)